MNNFSRAGVMGGLFIAGGGCLRYLILWPDPSQAFIYVLGGLLVSGVSFLYGRQKELIETIFNAEEGLQDHLLNHREEEDGSN